MLLGEVEFILLGFAVVLIGVGFLVVVVRAVAAVVGGAIRALTRPFGGPVIPPGTTSGRLARPAGRYICRDVQCRHVNRPGSLYCSQCGQRL